MNPDRIRKIESKLKLIDMVSVSVDKIFEEINKLKFVTQR